MSKCAPYYDYDYGDYYDYGDENDANFSSDSSFLPVMAVDSFCWLVEGVLILLVGGVGLAGNSLSLIIFSRQKVHRIFHNLLLTLTIFDMVSDVYPVR